MEGIKNRLIIILFILLIISCSLFVMNRDGWYYIKKGEIFSAHKEFLRDYAYNPDSIQNVSGLAYTFFLLNMPDSALKYVEISRQLNADTTYTLFVSLLYYHFYNNFAADTIYELFLSDYAYINTGFFIDSIIEYRDMHKMGLLSLYSLEKYERVYNILKIFTNINKNLDINDENTQKILFDYINNL